MIEMQGNWRIGTATVVYFTKKWTVDVRPMWWLLGGGSHVLASAPRCWKP